VKAGMNTEAKINDIKPSAKRYEEDQRDGGVKQKKR
jgi:hypothetical protein